MLQTTTERFWSVQGFFVIFSRRKARFSSEDIHYVTEILQVMPGTENIVSCVTHQLSQIKMWLAFKCYTESFLAEHLNKEKKNPFVKREVLLWHIRYFSLLIWQAAVQHRTSAVSSPKRMLLHTKGKTCNASSKSDYVPNSPAEHLDSAGVDHSGIWDRKDPTVFRATTCGAHWCSEDLKFPPAASEILRF